MDSDSGLTHEDIWRRQQQTDINLARMDGKIDNILQMLTVRSQQIADDRAAGEKQLELIRAEASERSKALWERFTQTDKAIEHVRIMAENKIDSHKDANGHAIATLTTKVTNLDGKLLGMAGAISVLSFLLVVFAPMIQERIFTEIPPHPGSVRQLPQYELKK